MMSAFCNLMQPLETCLPIEVGSLVPWMRYSVLPRYSARAPIGFAHNRFNAGPSEALTSDADAIAHRHAMTERQVEEGMRGIDDDGPGRLFGRIRHHLVAKLRRQLLRSGLFDLLLQRVLRQWLIKAKCWGERKRLRRSGTGRDRDNRKRRDRAAKTCAANC